ncbi:MAG: tRNA (adenosine(37)-N6)-threonylcarbamoyltransferase complex dimerization subunit type 1 TsaB [Bacteroidia bacterium]
MALILQIDTATPVCSAAVSLDGEVISKALVDEGYRHAENIISLCRKVIAETKYSIQDLEAVAVSAGPGSYTGLRIGVSAAKGLCYGLEIPLLTVSTLRMMALQFYAMHTGFDGLAVPMIDARRMEVYTGIYNQNGECLLPDCALVVDSSAYGGIDPNAKLAFFGDGAGKCRDVLEPLFGNARFDLDAMPDAAALSKPAHQAFEKGEFANLAYFEPEYLKPYQGTPPSQK